MIPSRMLSARVTTAGIDARARAASQVSVNGDSAGKVFAFREFITILRKFSLNSDIKSDQNSSSIALSASVPVTLAFHGTEGGKQYVLKDERE